MHSLQLELSEFSRRRRSVEMTIDDETFSRRFETGEKVLINDPNSGWWSAVIAEVGPGSGDHSYRINLIRQISVVQAHREALIAASRRFSAHS